ncbi:MAG TPA: DUF72 domain-containing protein [Urbifossiella sp.]|jgi:uncharacterized protein YecE (DUF72 family)|nr:DUF72 domain-containing protein [Urbifossiella sp.]
MRVYVGTSGFSYPKWKGRFYPAKLPAKDMLGYYAGRFRAVEINNTFYKLPPESVLTGWAGQVPADFRFAYKAPQEITHFKRLREVDGPVAAFLKAVVSVHEQRGPLLFQLPPNFKKDVPRLRGLLALLPPGCRPALEFRHASWFDDEVFSALREHHAALCVAEESDDLAVPFVATADWGYLRLRRLDYDDAALAAWAARIKAQPWGDCFVFFKHEDTGTGPDFAARLLKALGEGSPPTTGPKVGG